ncbi:hypothetical protein PVK06_040197 [Gossypium arboreum]|uniref:DUF721 domain-containing protein n=1 Tax=Gossypium arboreum TaxID=29729 RepID=A0ABR0N4T5_GOSAR|nr:hypothetical protein PVK06_040197 [Gossypium arboreum]
MAKELATKPIELPLRTITRTRAKKFKEAIASYLDRIWGETITGHIDHSWTSSIVFTPAESASQIHWTALEEIKAFGAELKTKLLITLLQVPIRGDQWTKAHSH